LTLRTIQITSPTHPPDLRMLDVPGDAVPQRCGPVALWSMTADRERAAPGEIVGLRWVWEAVQSPEMAFMAGLTLLDAKGVAVRTWKLPLSAAWWPTDHWSAGERWVGRPVIRLPGGLESGDYRFELGLLGCETPLANITLTVEALERLWQVPGGVTPLDVAFAEPALGAQLRLAGFAVETQTLVPGEKLPVRLAWQALAEMETSYRIFVHLMDVRGLVVGQSDGEPDNWLRPTTGWAVGEVVAEVREIDIPGDLSSGVYVLRVGVYREDGTRLMTRSPAGVGLDAYELLTLRVP
jgi:hypothetical protein